MSNSKLPASTGGFGPKTGAILLVVSKGVADQLARAVGENRRLLAKACPVLLTKSPIAVAPRQHAAEHRDADAATYRDVRRRDVAQT